MTPIRIGFTLLALGLLPLATGCPPAPYSLGFEGPYETTSYEAAYGDGLPVTVWMPKEGQIEGPLPVVIFTGGWNQPRLSYAGYAEQLAQWGYICGLRFYPSLGIGGLGDPMLDEQIQFSITLMDWFTAEHERPDSPLFGKVDASRFGTAGHSLGGTTAIGTAIVDPRVRAAVSLDLLFATLDFDPIRQDVLPGNPARLEGANAALLYIGADSGSMVCQVPPGEAEPLYDYSAPPAMEVRITDADHMDFVDSLVGLSYLGQIVCPTNPEPPGPQEVRDITMRYLIPWLNVYVKGQEEFQEFFTGDISLQDEQRGTVSARRNLP